MSQLLPFSEFLKLHDKYPSSISSIYHIAKDLYVKSEVVDICVLDGNSVGLDNYCITCGLKTSETKRILIPWSMEIDLDLLW